MKKKQILSIIAGLATFSAVTTAHAAEAVDPNLIEKVKENKYIAFAIALLLGISVLGGAIAQGRVGSTSVEGISRNPGAADKMFTPSILGLVLIESLVIYALVISFLLYAKMA